METTNQIILSLITLDEWESRFDTRIQHSLEKFLGTAIKKESNAEEKDILTFKEGCKFLNIAEPTGYAKISKRELPFLKKGKFIYFSKKQLTDWLHSGQRKTVEQMEEEAREYTSKSKSKKAA
jgi:excisionase family DNA binding protein